MRVLVIDHILMFGAPVAQRLALEGHEVVYSSVWGPDSDNPMADFLCSGHPKIKVVPEGWMKWAKWADVATVTGSEHRGHVVKFLRDQGVPVAAPGAWGAALELDRAFGTQIAEEAGLKVPWQKRFTDPGELIRFIETNPKRYVFKVDQTARAYAETTVAADPKSHDIIEVVRRMESQMPFKNPNVGYYLYEMLEGSEVAVGGWFNGETFIGDLYLSFDGSGGFCYDLRYSGFDLVDRKRLEKRLHDAKYRGPLDINGMLVDGEFHYLEWTPRWGMGMTEFYCHAAENLGEMLRAVATGREALPVAKKYQGKVAAVLNVRDESYEYDNFLDVTLPKGEDLPVIRENASFWVMWPAKSPEGRWVSLPVHTRERRKAAYVGFGSSFAAAVGEAESLADEALLSQAAVDGSRTLKELSKRVDSVQRHMLGEGWIDRMAAATRHNWTSPLRSPRP